MSTDTTQQSASSRAGASWQLVVFGIFLVIVGAAMLYGGIELVGLGGSWYYALAGAGLVLSGLLYGFRRIAGLWLFALVFSGTVIWATWEAGLEFWPLIPRLVAPAVVAVVAALLTPLFPSHGGRKRGAFTVASLLVVALAATAFFAFTSHGVTRRSVAEASATTVSTVAATTDWRFYGRTPAGTRFAPINQINRDNVKNLEVAWTFRTGDTPTKSAQDQNTPLQVADTLYTCSPHNIVHALNAETGQLRWKFDPHASSPIWQRCRGVSFYEPPAQPAAGGSTATDACAARIVLTTIDARLIELDAKTGQPCLGFGVDGVIDLRTGMGEVNDGVYFQTSAPTVMRDLVLIGGWVWDDIWNGEASGVVRAFSATTGQLVWAWDLGNPAITASPTDGKSYTRGTPNVWSTPAYDDALGLVYLPTGSAKPDFFGAHRSEAVERYSTSIVALDITTGHERWKFQTARHDIWDYDVPSQPALYDIPDGKGGRVPALIQLTKRGQTFVLDRRNGTPITEVTERPVVQTGGLPEDFVAPTQPYSTGMPAIGVEPLTEARMWGATPLDQLYCRIQFRKMRYDGEFTPPGTDVSLIYPGYYGGMNWGSAAIDETNAILVVNDIRMPQTIQLVPQAQAKGGDASPAPAGPSADAATPYAAIKNGFMSPLGIPCHQPPYGTITGIDLISRTIVWQVPAGTLRDSGPLRTKMHLPIPIGMPSLGGPVTTSGGIVFYAGTQDYYLRALDTLSGEELWKARLPVGAQATPMTYVSPESGQQFVVISAGGARLSPDRGDYVIAFKLPRRE